MWLPEAKRGREWGVTSGTGFLSEVMESLLEVDSSDGAMTLCIYEKLLNCTL